MNPNKTINVEVLKSVINALYGADGVTAVETAYRAGEALWNAGFDRGYGIGEDKGYSDGHLAGHDRGYELARAHAGTADQSWIDGNDDILVWPFNDDGSEIDTTPQAENRSPITDDEFHRTMDQLYTDEMDVELPCDCEPSYTYYDGEKGELITLPVPKSVLLR